MNCPLCGSSSIVKETRGTVSGAISRRRICAKGHRFTTRQKPGGREVLKPEFAKGK